MTQHHRCVVILPRSSLTPGCEPVPRHKLVTKRDSRHHDSVGREWRRRVRWGECDPDVTCCTSCPGFLRSNCLCYSSPGFSPPARRRPDQMHSSQIFRWHLRAQEGTHRKWILMKQKRKEGEQVAADSRELLSLLENVEIFKWSYFMHIRMRTLSFMAPLFLSFLLSLSPFLSFFFPFDCAIGQYIDRQNE